jgi:hypothetical protein
MSTTELSAFFNRVLHNNKRLGLFQNNNLWNASPIYWLEHACEILDYKLFLDSSYVPLTHWHFSNTAKLTTFHIEIEEYRKFRAQNFLLI